MECGLAGVGVYGVRRPGAAVPAFLFPAAINRTGNTKAAPGRSTPQAAPIRFMHSFRLSMVFLFRLCVCGGSINCQ